MNGTVMLIIYVVLFGAIFYFLAIRPQRRQKQQHQEMISMLKRGDEVVTIGGAYGTVKKVGPDWVLIEIAPRTQVKFMKRAISSITTPEIEEEEYVDEEEEYEDEDQAALEAAEDEDYDEEEGYDEAYDESEGEEEYVEDEEYEGEGYAEEEALEEEEAFDSLDQEAAEDAAGPQAGEGQRRSGKRH